MSKEIQNEDGETVIESMAVVECENKRSDCEAEYGCRGKFLVKMRKALDEDPPCAGDRFAFHPTSNCPCSDVGVIILHHDDEYTRFQFRMGKFKRKRKNK